jgi:hypothetical protein
MASLSETFDKWAGDHHYLCNREARVKFVLGRFAQAVVTLAVSTIACGCGSDAPPLGQVTGTITLDSKPVEGAVVAFEPASGGLPPAYGKTDASGKYELWYGRGNRGTAIGESLVRINAFEEAGDDPGSKRRPETIPAKYNAKTELKVDVKRGKQVQNFDLKSGGEIIQPDVEGGGTQRRSPTGCN